MATTYFKGRGKRKNKTAKTTVKETIEYSANPTKTENYKYVTINNLGHITQVASKENIDSFIKDINRHHDLYKILNGRGVDEHFKKDKATPFVMMTIRQSFLTDECTPEVAHKIGIELAKKVLGNKFKYAVCTHTNTQTVHNHIEFSPVDANMKKYKSSKLEFLKIQKISDEICEQFGLSTVIKSKQKRSKVYSKSKPISFRKILKEDIDKTIKSVKSYDEFIEKMREKYIVNTNRKHLTFKHKTNGQQKNIRSYTLGKSYTEEMLKFRCNPVPHIKLNQKIKLRFMDIVLLKHRKAYNKPQYKNYYQSRKNIFYLSNAINVITQNQIGSYHDLKNVIENFNNKCNILVDKLDIANESIEKINNIILNIQTYEKYKSINNEYQNSILKKTFYNEHKDQLDKFNEACLFLYDKNIDVNLNTNKYLSKLSEIREGKEKIKDELDETNKSLNQIINTKKTIDNLYHKNYYEEQHKEIRKEKKYVINR